MNIQVPVIVPEERVPELYQLVATWLNKSVVAPIDVEPPLAPWSLDDVELAAGLFRNSSSAGKDIIMMLAAGDDMGPHGGAWVVDPASKEEAWGLPADILAKHIHVPTPAAVVGCLGSLSRACARAGRRSFFFSTWAKPAQPGDSSLTEPRPVRYYAMAPGVAQVFPGGPDPDEVFVTDGDSAEASTPDDQGEDEDDGDGFHILLSEEGMESLRVRQGLPPSAPG